MKNGIRVHSHILSQSTEKAFNYLLMFHLFTLHLFPFLSGILYFLLAPLKFAAVVCFISPINLTAVELAFSAVVCFISPVNSLNSTTVEFICLFVCLTSAISLHDLYAALHVFKLYRTCNMLFYFSSGNMEELFQMIHTGN